MFYGRLQTVRKEEKMKLWLGSGWVDFLKFNRCGLPYLLDNFTVKFVPGGYGITGLHVVCVKIAFSSILSIYPLCGTPASWLHNTVSCVLMYKCYKHTKQRNCKLNVLNNNICGCEHQKLIAHVFLHICICTCTYMHICTCVFLLMWLILCILFVVKGTSIVESLPEMFSKIDVSGHSIADKDAESFVEVLQQKSHVDTFDVSNTSLTTATAIKITEALKSDKVKVLNMQGNTIGDEATESIVAVLNNNHLLQQLNISHNQFSFTSAIEIVYALSSVNAFTVLNISHNLITADCIDTLASGLANCLTLQELDISHNLFAFNGVIKIAQALRSHPNLRILDLNDSFRSFLSEKEFLVDVILSTNLSLTNLNVCDRNIRPRFTGKHLSPPPQCEAIKRFQLHNLYKPLYFLDVTSEGKLPDAPDKFIKATETCPFLKDGSASNEYRKIDSYYVNHKGGTFYNHNHDFAIVVPPYAVSPGDCVEIQATASQFGPYELPDDCTPISSYYWTSASYTFKIPVYLIMSHYAKFNSLEDINGVCVMQACVRDPEIIRDGKQVMKEVPIDSCYFDYDIGYCIVVNDHFCSTCLRKKNKKISENFIATYYTFNQGYIAEVSAVQANKDCFTVRTVLYVCTCRLMYTLKTSKSLLGLYSSYSLGNCYHTVPVMCKENLT